MTPTHLAYRWKTFDESLVALEDTPLEFVDRARALFEQIEWSYFPYGHTWYLKMLSNDREAMFATFVDFLSELEVEIAETSQSKVTKTEFKTLQYEHKNWLRSKSNVITSR